MDFVRSYFGTNNFLQNPYFSVSWDGREGVHLQVKDANFSAFSTTYSKSRE